MLKNLFNVFLEIFGVSVLFLVLPAVTSGFHVPLGMVMYLIAAATVIVVLFHLMYVAPRRSPAVLTTGETTPIEPVTDYHINHTVIETDGDVRSHPQ